MTSDPGASSNPYRPPETSPESPPPRAPASEFEEAAQTIIPTRNVPALVGYYLGLFSCFPVLGLPLAIAGIVLGWKDLKKVRSDPTAHGTAHAWVGLICGGIGLVINLLITAALVLTFIGWLLNETGGR